MLQWRNHTRKSVVQGKNIDGVSKDCAQATRIPCLQVLSCSGEVHVSRFFGARQGLHGSNEHDAHSNEADDHDHDCELLGLLQISQAKEEREDEGCHKAEGIQMIWIQLGSALGTVSAPPGCNGVCQGGVDSDHKGGQRTIDEEDNRQVDQLAGELAVNQELLADGTDLNPVTDLKGGCAVALDTRLLKQMHRLIRVRILCLALRLQPG
mmetsp:Transcript_59780/g.142283  ORF Transcript_59780/g.142283 Transcript_59780/m.142283 type:complete len:209 (-) Transcript_59780:475-1101(-)